MEMVRRAEISHMPEKSGVAWNNVDIWGGQILRCTNNGATYPNGQERADHAQCLWVMAASEAPGQFEVILAVNLENKEFGIRCPKCRGTVELIYFENGEPVRMKDFPF